MNEIKLNWFLIIQAYLAPISNKKLRKEDLEKKKIMKRFQFIICLISLSNNAFA